LENIPVHRQNEISVETKFLERNNKIKFSPAQTFQPYLDTYPELLVFFSDGISLQSAIECNLFLELE
jgi:hypothetical protein